ncbi:MAG: DUF3120 domain-containing protein [Cyanobium sp.]|nr:DUF3120 domain-containing protein [Cyanobacteriota bacterium]
MIGLPTSSLPTRSLLVPSLGAWGLPSLAAFLTLGPVFLQAPLVRVFPMGAALATVPLLLLALALALHPHPTRQRLGMVLVGFAGSWLGGALFWGWAREYPFWHLPIEAFALPLALGGLQTRWRLGASFYLASLLGTAATDGLIAATGLMPLWPQVVQASPLDAGALLQSAAQSLLHPLPLLAMGLAAGWILLLARQLWGGDAASRVAAAALASTLVVDGLFFGAALLAPHLSGLI